MEGEKIVNCSHCGKRANFEGWENGWPLYGKITLGLDCCSLDSLWGKNWHNKGYGFDHPAMLPSGYQEINFEWGNGMKFDSTGKYRLCWDCQRELMGKIGEFFKEDIAYIAQKQKEGKTVHPTTQAV